MTSIRDVAQAANVSISTVSRVLNPRHEDLVAPETRRRVKEAAERLEYRPSAAATALVDGRTSTVALHASRLGYNSSYCMRFVDITQRIAAQEGFHLLVVPGDPDFDPASLLRERRVDVLIWTHFPVERADQMTRCTAGTHQAIIGCGPIDRRPPEIAHAGYWDDRIGYGLLVDHLADLGHERVAILAGAQVGTRAWPNLLEGCEEAIERRNLESSVVTAADESHSLQAGADMARQAMTLRPRPTALIARNDDFAIGAIHALTEDGITVPSEISVVGYNNMPLSAFSAPALTTVHNPISETLHELLPSVLRQVAQAEPEHRLACTFPVRLIERDSSAAAP